jgi:hypothetical protein
MVTAGQPATITLSYLPGAAIVGKVAYVYPYLDPTNRTARVRIALPNKDLALKPDMYATVELTADLGPRLQIPVSAVVYTGTRRIVFVDIGEGRLQPAEVELGARNAEMVEVVGGLTAGQPWDRWHAITDAATPRRPMVRGEDDPDPDSPIVKIHREAEPAVALPEGESGAVETWEDNTSAIDHPFQLHGMSVRSGAAPWP